MGMFLGGKTDRDVIISKFLNIYRFCDVTDPNTRFYSLEDDDVK